MHIVDKTHEPKGCAHRGDGIKRWMKCFVTVESFVVLDDEIFDDYDRCGILPHLVKTSFYDNHGGLQDEHVEQAIALLNTKQND